jgi:hypothetical protein
MSSEEEDIYVCYLVDEKTEEVGYRKEVLGAHPLHPKWQTRFCSQGIGNVRLKHLDNFIREGTGKF